MPLFPGASTQLELRLLPGWTGDTALISVSRATSAAVTPWQPGCLLHVFSEEARRP